LPSGGNYSGNNVSSGNYDPSIVRVDTLKYIFINGNSCKDSAISIITVDSIPVVAIGTFNAICKGSTPITLNSGTPSGGVYFGNNVSLGLFVPFTVGVDTIYYTYKDGNNCSDTAAESIMVNALPSATFGSLSNVCANSPAFNLNGGLPSGGVYSGNNVSGGMYTSATSGSDTLVYT
jgi:hypothetical protein